MLVFGAVSFKSCNDGGIEVIVDKQRQFLNSNDARELLSWVQFHLTNNQKTNPFYGGLRAHNEPVVHAEWPEGDVAQAEVGQNAAVGAAIRGNF